MAKKKVANPSHKVGRKSCGPLRVLAAALNPNLLQGLAAGANSWQSVGGGAGWLQRQCDAGEAERKMLKVLLCIQGHPVSPSLLVVLQHLGQVASIGPTSAFIQIVTH